jgi:NADPH:quinone reductase-like Zn-dependent oxidoreductase
MKHLTLASLGLIAAGTLAAAQCGLAAAAIPAQQQAVVQTGTGGPETLKLQTIPVLQPGPGQVLVRVQAAALNPTDWGQLTRPNTGASGQRVLGADLSGVIVAAGPDTAGRPVGMAVFAVTDRGSGALNGAYSQYALVPKQNTAPKPSNLGYDEAAGLGIVGVTALRMIDNAQVQSGQRVLITGVAGGVGSVAAQIAVARGAQVIGTASARHAAYLHSIGVSQVIDYTQGDVASHAGMVDAVLDTVGGEEAVQVLRAIKAGGHFITVGHAELTPEQCSAVHVQCLGSPGSASGAPVAVLEQVGTLAQQGKLHIHIDRTYALDRAAEALQYLHEGHVEGKVILTVAAKAK